MNATERYFNGELSPDMKESFYNSLLQDGKELLNVISTLGLMKKAADFPQEEPPPELEPPSPEEFSLAEELLGLTMKALTESGETQCPASGEHIEIPEPVVQRHLPEQLVQLIARLDTSPAVLPPPSPSGSRHV